MKHLALLLCGTLLAAPAFAAQPAPTDAEPAVDVSRTVPATRPVAPATGPAATNDASQSPPTTTPAGPPAGQPARPAPARGTADRIELSTTQVTGNAELPRVMYVVPWKRAELGEVAGKPARSLLDEVLAPVDRDVFRRQNRYYDALQPDAGRAAPEGEK